MRYRLGHGMWTVVSVAALAVWTPSQCSGVAVSPRLIDAARGAPDEAGVRQRIARHEAARAAGVDRIYRRFALDLSRAADGAPAHRNVLVVLCDFDSDSYGPAWHPAAASTPAYYDSLFFSDDPGDGLTSMREYYRANSRGRLILSGRVTTGWLTMPHSYAYYVNGQSGLAFGSHPRSAQGLAEDAMTAAYASFGNNLDFFDNDGPDGVPHSGDDDGYVDAVCVIHPGVGAEVVAGSQSNLHLWSHEAGISVYSDCPAGASSPGCLPGMMLGDVRGFLYFLGPEFYDAPHDRAVGTYFHEFAHTIGLADLYGAQAGGLGFYSLMAFGSYLPIDPAQGALASHPANLDAWSRTFIGFEAAEAPSAPGAHLMVPVEDGGGSIRAWTNGRPGSEYFLMENRSQTGADTFLPGSGMLVYHVDDTRIDNLNYDGGRFRVAVVQADGRDDLGTPLGNLGDPGDFFPGSTGNRTWNEATSPDSRDYSGQDTQVRMSDVTRSGTGTVSFNLSVSTRPALQVASYRIGDGDNGFADANERDSLFVSVENPGFGSGPVTYTLMTGDPYVTVDAGFSHSEAVTMGSVADLSEPFIVEVAAPPVLPHLVPLTLAWNDGTASGAASFTLSIGMRAGLSEDFESGSPGWTHQALAPGAADDWHASSSRAHAGGTSMKLGSRNELGDGSNVAQTYAPMQDAVLVSPMFRLDPGSKLTFYSWIDAETNGGTGAWDGGRVEIARNGGPWHPLDVEGGYGYVIEYFSASALRGQHAFSGSPERWRRVTADLSGYQGSVQVRFRFSCDDFNAPVDPLGNQTRYYEGWYVDDVAVSRELSASIDLDPDVINLRNRAPWVTAYIEPSGFDPAGIDLSTLRLGGSVAAEAKLAVSGDRDSNGIPDLMVKFARAALDPLLTPGMNTLEVTGSLVSGEPFRGADEVRVIDPPGLGPAANVAPNPFNPSGVLTFRTEAAGPVAVRIYDLSGRLVRTLLDDGMLPAGAHALRLDGRDARGARLASGVYFFRVLSPDGEISGRFAILK